jgi:protein ImuB
MEPEHTREILRRSPITILDGPASLPRVVSLNDPARRLGIEAGMTKLQVETCGAALLRKQSKASEDSAQEKLVECAGLFSPRLESTCAGIVLLDLAGTEKLFGTFAQTAKAILAKAKRSSFQLRVAVASNLDTAQYAARGFSGITIVPRGCEAVELGRLNVNLLPLTPEILDTLTSWGIRTFKSFAALPEVPLAERLGQSGLYFQKLARGQINRTLIPLGSERRFVESYEFDDPVETLESLSFVLNRLLQEVCSALVSHALATNELRLTLDLEVTQRERGRCDDHYRHEWKLPVPTQDSKILFTLLRLDLERTTFSAPIGKVTVEVVVQKPRAAQGSLFAPPCPEAENLAITLARIRGVVGDADTNGLSCVGSPAIIDTHLPGVFTVQPFSSVTEASESETRIVPMVALRRFRPALEASVELAGDIPNRVCLWRKDRRVLAASGPWCSSGTWWNQARGWAHEEWDVALRTSAGIGFFRIYRDRLQQRWFVEGIFD